MRQLCFLKDTKQLVFTLSWPSGESLEDVSLSVWGCSSYDTALTLHVRGTGIDALHLQNCFCIAVNLKLYHPAVCVCVCVRVRVRVRVCVAPLMECTLTCYCVEQPSLML